MKLLLLGLICFNTQPPEGGWRVRRSGHGPLGVSTHSRLKAAGCFDRLHAIVGGGFNTQPPEGGWQAKALP